MKRIFALLITLTLLGSTAYAIEVTETDTDADGIEDTMTVRSDINFDGIADDIILIRTFGADNTNYTLSIDDALYTFNHPRYSYAIIDILDININDNAKEVLLFGRYHGSTTFDIIRYEDGNLYPLAFNYEIRELPNLYNHKDFVCTTNGNGDFLVQSTHPYTDTYEYLNFKESIKDTLTLLPSENITVTLDNEIISYDILPFFKNDRTMVGVRATFEAMGAEVIWDEATETVFATRDDVIISLQIGNSVMYKNDEPVLLDAPAMLTGGRTFIPARSVAEAFGYNVDFESDKNAVVITK